MSKSSRVIFNIFLFTSIYVFPWWAVLTVAIISCWKFDRFYFGIFVGFAMDLIYTSHFVLNEYTELHNFVLGWPFTLTITSIFVIFDLIKKRIRI